jgi:hypothetical protein
VQKVDLEKTHVGDMPTEAHINQDIRCGSSVALDSSSSIELPRMQGPILQFAIITWTLVLLCFEHRLTLNAHLGSLCSNEKAANDPVTGQ